MLGLPRLRDRCTLPGNREEQLQTLLRIASVTLLIGLPQALRATRASGRDAARHPHGGWRRGLAALGDRAQQHRTRPLPHRDRSRRGRPARHQAGVAAVRRSRVRCGSKACRGGAPAILVALDGSGFIDDKGQRTCDGATPGQYGANVRTTTNPGLAAVDTQGVEIARPRDPQLLHRRADPSRERQRRSRTAASWRAAAAPA